MKKNNKNNVEGINENMIEAVNNLGENIVDVTEAVEDSINEITVENDISNVSVSVEIEATIESVDTENIVDAESMSTDIKDESTDTPTDKNDSLQNDSKEKNITSEKKQRRESKTGSIYPIYKVNKEGIKEIYRWGLCIQFDNATAEQKKLYKNKLRYLSTSKTYDEILVALERCMRNKDKLLADKLKKLGYVGEIEDIKE